MNHPIGFDANLYSLASDIFFGHNATVDNCKTTNARQNDVFQNFCTQCRHIDQTQLCRFEMCLAMFTPQSNKIKGPMNSNDFPNDNSSHQYPLTAIGDRISYSFRIIPVTMRVMTSLTSC